MKLTVAIIVAALAVLLFQAVDATPLVPPPGELSAASFTRVKGILRANDPRRLRPDTTREVAIAGADLKNGIAEFVVAV